LQNFISFELNFFLQFIGLFIQSSEDKIKPK